ncbi:hypothetical protein BX666DRAFT_1429579 [Dichotomocladium elegans]|nr:hypothetical protein BX666DRAFT_1429579 [Dichotomocladium elegans]
MLKGTAKDPYNIAVSFVAEDSNSDIDIMKGHCDCPVGEKGKCKHCASIMLRFMINTAEFEYSTNIIAPYDIDTVTALDGPNDIKKQETFTTEDSTSEQTFPDRFIKIQEEHSSVDDTSSMSVGTLPIPNETSPIENLSSGTMLPKPRTKSRFLPWTAVAVNDPPRKKGRRQPLPENEDDMKEIGHVPEKKSTRKSSKRRQADDKPLSEDEPRSKRKARRKKRAPSSSPSPSPPASPSSPMSLPLQQLSQLSTLPQDIPIPESPSDITMVSTPRETGEDVDSDATEDGLGPVMGSTQRTTSLMSLNSPSLATSAEASEMRNSSQEMNDDNEKTDKSSLERNAMDDLFDEIGL